MAHTTNIGLNAPGRQPAVGRQFLSGDGIIAGDAQALRQGELQQGVLVEGEVVDLDVVEVLLPIGPVEPSPISGDNFQQSPKAPYW